MPAKNIDQPDEIRPLRTLTLNSGKGLIIPEHLVALGESPLTKLLGSLDKQDANIVEIAGTLLNEETRSLRMIASDKLEPEARRAAKVLYNLNVASALLDFAADYDHVDTHHYVDDHMRFDQMDTTEAWLASHDGYTHQHNQTFMLLKDITKLAIKDREQREKNPPPSSTASSMVSKFSPRSIMDRDLPPMEPMGHIDRSDRHKQMKAKFSELYGRIDHFRNIIGIENAMAKGAGDTSHPDISDMTKDCWRLAKQFIDDAALQARDWERSIEQSQTRSGGVGSRG